MESNLLQSNFHREQSSGMIESNDYFFIIFSVLFVLFSFPLIIWFLLRIKIHPIKGRHPYLVVSCAIFMVVYVLVSSFQRIVADNYPCYLTLWSGYLGVIVLCQLFIIRCWKLLFSFNLTQEIASSESKSNWCSEHRTFSSFKFLVPLNTLIIIILIIPPLILTFTSSEIVNGQGDDCSYSYGFGVLAGYGAVYVIIFIFFSWKLRSVVEGFYIKNELRLMGIIVLVSIFIWFMINSFFEQPLNDKFPLSTLAILLGCLCGFAVLICLPLYYSYKKKEKSQYEFSNEDRNLDFSNLINILNNEKGYESFKKHLMKEFSVENILFWSDCKKIKELSNLAENDKSKQRDINQQSVYIFMVYILPDSPREINIPSSMRKELIDLFYRSVSNIGFITSSTESIFTQDLNPDIWKQCEHEIVYLLEKDSFHRYICSESYNDFLISIGQKSLANQV